MEPSILNQRYRLLEQIGAGGMATVYRGHDLLLDRPIAVKVLRELYASAPDFRNRFLAEARAAARLDHPNIVRIYDVGEAENQQPYIVMEIVEGEDLKSLIRAQRPLPVPKALNLARQICAGVGHAHRAGIIHCDLKPENILVTPTGQVKVADFGIARVFQDELRSEKEQVIWGSPHYISPEQVAGEPPVPASDVYSIGVILYEMLTGVPPFHADDPTQLVIKHLQEEPPPLTSINPRIPPQLEWLVRKVLAKEPANRYRNAEQFGLAIEEYIRQGAEVTRPQAAVTMPAQTHPQAPHPAAQPEPKEIEEPTQPFSVDDGPDWLLGVLWVVAFVAVVGLIPLWFFVINTYQASTPTPAATAITGTPTIEAPGTVVTVPNLVGLSAPDAQRLAEGLGLALTVLGEQEAAGAVPGAIITQQPGAGTRAPGGTTIQVVVAAGRTYILPSVVGYPLDMVRTQLETEGLLIAVEEIWSTETTGKILEQTPQAGVEVRAGATITLTVSGGIEQSLQLQVNLNNQIILEDAQVQQVAFHPGDSVPVTLRWRCIHPLDRSYTVFVHLLTPSGQMVSQQDLVPVSGSRPTNTWQPGEIIRDPHQVTIPAGTPAGTYQIRVGLYIPEGRLPVIDSGNAQVIDDSIFITSVEINP